MKVDINRIYDKIIDFLPLAIKDNPKINHKEFFPVVGFLDNEKKKALESAIDFKIKNVAYFEQALLHRSYLQVIGQESPCYSNERLEFLGDAILGMIIADYLFNSYGGRLEGELTKMRACIVNRNSLALCANEIGLDHFVMLSYSAEKALKGGSDSILADALEAVIAAVYLDSDINKAREFVLEKLLPILLQSSIFEDKNFKSILLEKAQALGFSAPKYTVLEETGPDHDKKFVVGVIVGEEVIGNGIGKNKKQAEQSAARDALTKNLFSNNIESDHGTIDI